MTVKYPTWLIISCCCLLSLFSLAQQKPATYPADWKKVDSLIAKGLSQSALTRVNLIYTRARQDKNEPQTLKALIYRLRLQEENKDDGDTKAITDLEKELPDAQQPARSILQSLLADLYWNYLQLHRRQLSDRTQTEGSQKDSIDTWTIDDLHNRIATLYLASIRDEKLLKDTKLETYEPIIIKGNMRVLRPTLFDLLAHRALDYFKTDEQYLTQPENIFELDDPAAFADAATFVRHTFKTPDSLSLHHKALLLFQQLISFHLNDARPDALLDVDIERLGFVNNYAVMEEKDSAYLAALRILADRWGQAPAAAQAWYLLALDASTKAGKYSPTRDTTGKYGYVTAKAICEKVLAQKDSSEGKSNCAQLLTSIQRKSLKVEMEDVNLPEQPMRALITWSNLSAIHGRIVAVDLTKTINSYSNDFWKKLLQLPAIRTFHQPLPATGDYQSHSAEIKVDALPIGAYALIVDADSAFDPSGRHIAMVYFQVSNISYVSNGNDIFILHRRTGRPIANATVQMWALVQKVGGAPATRVRKEVYHTDAHGYFYNKLRKGLPEEQYAAAEITTEKDYLYTEYIASRDWSSMGSWPTDPKTDTGHLYTYFFTDRSIYRPGQKIYFKGIVIAETWRKLHPGIKANFKEKVWLKDGNFNNIDSIEVTTNEYGSFHGVFKLPEQVLTGEFSLHDSAFGTASFSVEEYKRPSFFVDYDTLKSNYQIGDTIRIEGYAKAYAGNAIDGATVKYRVARQVHYFYPCTFCEPLRSIGASWGGWGPVNRREDVKEIAHGTIKTDPSGKFYISFPATPDRSIDKNTDPVFEYTVSTDVTDINGETRTGERIVRAGYKSMTLTIDQPSESSLPSDALKQLLIKTTNLSGVAVSANVHVTVNTLRRPSRMLRERRWTQPDQFILPKDEYIRLFPHDIYDKEDYNPENWQKGENILDTTALSNRPINLAGLTDKKLAPGWFAIEATSTGKDGQTIKTKIYLELYDASSGKQAIPTYRWAAKEDQTVEPGEKATITIGSSAENVVAIRRIYRGPSQDEKYNDTFPSSDKYQYLNLNKDNKTVELPVTENDRGGFWVTDIFVKDNDIFKRTYTVHVPWTNKQLSIRYDTYREKTLPGAEEKWKVTIKGPMKDKVAAEILAGMYDASLDQFKPHAWSMPDLYPSVSGLNPWDERDFGLGSSNEKYVWSNPPPGFIKTYDALLSITAGIGRSRRVYSVAGSDMYLRTAPMHKALTPVDPGKPYAIQIPDLDKDPDGSKGLTLDNVIVDEDQPLVSPEPGVQIRKNFSETAFFFPDLHTDDSGSVSFSFTVPEALTRWKGMIFAHTKDLAFGYSERSIITQKQLMVQPNLPRFLREGDRMELGVKVVNLSDSEMTGQIELQLTDPTTEQTADGIFSNRQANQYFTVPAGQSAVVGFPIDIPYQYNKPLTYRIIARSKTYSDGEEAALPVVSNRMLVTESLPLDMPGDGTKEFHFEKLLHSDTSETLNHHALTVEFTSNPAWYAVQALPYLMEYPYECAEQTFNRFYANALATTIIHSSPRIRAIFDKWRTTDTAALLSNLEKNQELKSVLLQETPWVLQGKSESQQKQHIALLFDMVRMSRELESSLTKIQQMQSPNGGFVWFKGGPDDRYITQYILTGIGRLQKLNAIPSSMTGKVQDIVKAALPYLDGKIKKDYEDILKEKKHTPPTKKPAPVWIGEVPIDYLYMRSFFPQYGIPGNILPAITYYRKQAQQQWLQYSKYMQGMIALALFRTGDVQTARNIIASLKETAIRDEAKGMYWKGMEGGYYWWQAPIETQSLLIEAFHEVANTPGDEAALKTWLLRQKQTHNWSTTKATADACYALLMPTGSPAPGSSADNWLTVERSVDIHLGNKIVSSGETHTEAGTGYFKQVVDGARVQPSMGNITVTIKTQSTASSGQPAPSSRPGTAAPSSLPAWGAVYWQYFENLDKITAADPTKAPLRLVKKLFIEKNTDRGPVLEPVAENGVLHPGDKVKVRIELHSDRDLEYVHMKDMRASCMEPVNILSQYKWQGGLGYYESTKDASTDFFFASLPKGTYVFEYPLFVGQKGNFSNGVTSIECMYAPEFGFHSEGIRVNVEEVTP